MELLLLLDACVQLFFDILILLEDDLLLHQYCFFSFKLEFHVAFKKIFVFAIVTNLFHTIFQFPSLSEMIFAADLFTVPTFDGRIGDLIMTHTAFGLHLHKLLVLISLRLTLFVI